MGRDVALLTLIRILFILFYSTAYADNPPETIYDEGIRKGTAFNLNCVGSGIACTQSGVTGTITVNGGGSGTINSGTTNRASRYSGATTLDSSILIYDDAINIGIGTITPRSVVELGVKTLNINGSNVGIGSFNPTVALCVGSTCQGKISSSGAVSSIGLSNISGAITNNTSYTQSGTDANTFTGNVGINGAGSAQVLSVIDTTGDGILFKGGSSRNMIVSSQSPGGNNYGSFKAVNSGSIYTKIFGSDNWNQTAWGTALANVDGIEFSGAATYIENQSNLPIYIGNNASNTVTQQLTIATGGNIGIGSTNPGQVLDVQGAIRMSTAPSLCSAGNYARGVDGSFNATGCTASGGGSSQWITYGQAGNVGIGTTDRVGIGTTSGSAGLAILNGNVGIGTWNPVSLLEVGAAKFNVSSTGNLTIGGSLEAFNTAGTVTIDNISSGSGAAMSVVGGASANSFLSLQSTNGVGTSDFIQFLTGNNGNHATIIQSDGNVGIGTATPGKLLDVQGTVRATAFSGSGATLTSIPESALNITDVTTGNSSTSAHGFLLKLNNSSSQFMNGQGVWATPAGGTNQWITYGQAGNVGIGTTDRVGIGTTSSSAGGLVVMNGNVGIGTWNPTTLLQINGTANATTLQQGGTGVVLTTRALTVAGTTNQITSSAGSQDLSADRTWTLSTPQDIATASNVTFNSGKFTTNVGIGTTLTNNVLAVNGGVSIGDTYAGVVVPTGLLAVKTNVGIGTFAPQAALCVGSTCQGKVTSVGAFTTVGLDNATTAMTNSAAYTQSGTSANTFSGTSAFTATSAITTTGNVGIGTTASQTALAITNGNVGIGTWTAANGLLQIMGTGNIGFGTTTPQTFLAITGGNVGIGTWTADGGSLIVKSGNVGIGTIAPQSIFTLGGNAHLGSTGTAPTVANNDCGSTAQGTITAGSTDLRGDVTAGTLNVTSCAVTFTTAFGKAPRCVVMDDTNILTVRATTTTTKLTIISTTSMSVGPDVITWLCIE